MQHRTCMSSLGLRAGAPRARTQVGCIHHLHQALLGFALAQRQADGGGVRHHVAANRLLWIAHKHCASGRIRHDLHGAHTLSWHQLLRIKDALASLPLQINLSLKQAMSTSSEKGQHLVGDHHSHVELLRQLHRRAQRVSECRRTLHMMRAPATAVIPCASGSSTAPASAAAPTAPLRSQPRTQAWSNGTLPSTCKHACRRAAGSPRPV